MEERNSRQQKIMPMKLIYSTRNIVAIEMLNYHALAVVRNVNQMVMSLTVGITLLAEIKRLDGWKKIAINNASIATST